MFFPLFHAPGLFLSPLKTPDILHRLMESFPSHNGILLLNSQSQSTFIHFFILSWVRKF